MKNKLMIAFALVMCGSLSAMDRSNLAASSADAAAPVTRLPFLETAQFYVDSQQAP